MTPAPHAPHRRAQPGLGTLVDIEVQAPADVAGPALEAAFRRVAEVQAAMSFHDPGSDLRRIARATPGDVITIAPDTHAVLALSLALEADSGGAFNPCCAPALVERGLLPHPGPASTPQAASLRDAIELLDGHQLRLRRPAWVDLGGIAKGHAVDCAIEALRAAGAEGGRVNAGGDLAVFGPEAMTVQLRDPRKPGLARPVARITDLACATSAWLLATPERRAAHLVGAGEPPGAVEDNPPMSVTVFAPRCALADALTKVVWLQADAAAPLLRRHGAQALVWRERGGHQSLP